MLFRDLGCMIVCMNAGRTAVQKEIQLATKNKGYTSLWKTILQIALAVLLICGGISIFTNAKNDALVSAVGSLFSGSLRDIVVYALAVIEIIAGALLVLDFFNIKAFDKLDDIFLLIIMICWIVAFMVFADILPFINGKMKFVPFLIAFAKDAVVVAAMGIIKAKI